MKTWCKYFAAVLMVLVLVILSTGIWTKPVSVESNPSLNEVAVPHTIFITGHGWHTGVVVSADRIFKVLPELQQRFAGASHLEIGWGDAGFYQNPTPTAGIALRAMFTPSSTVMHVVAVPKDVSAYFPSSQVKPVVIDEAGLNALLSFIESSFAREDQRLVSLSEGIYGNSQFYQATGSYYVMNTCNKWTAKALKSAGVGVYPYAMLTAESVLSAVSKP